MQMMKDNLFLDNGQPDLSKDVVCLDEMMNLMYINDFTYFLRIELGHIEVLHKTTSTDSALMFEI